jgi:hypothetical protein
MNDAVIPTAEVEAFTVQPVEAAPQALEPSSNVYDKVTNVAEFVEEMGTKLAKSGFAGCTKVEQGHMIILECMARKMSPLEFVTTFHIVSNKVSMRADAMLAKFRERGGQVRWKQFDTEAAVADFIIDEHSTEIGYTLKDAARAGLVNRSGPWKTYPAEMLRARLISKAVRMVCPEAIAGFYTPDELGDRSAAPVQEKQLFTANENKNETQSK